MPGIVGTIGFDQFQDDCNPRDWCNVGVMFCDYRGYSLGDEDAPDPRDQEDDEGEPLDIAEYLRREHGARVIMPLFVYEHSGVTMFAGEPISTVTRETFNARNRYPFDAAGWDTSAVGVIFDTPETVRECIGADATDDEIADAMRGEVKVYASWLEGDVCEFHVADDETGFSEGCGGFVGDADHCREECISALESAIVARLTEQTERADMAARDIVTV
ncbi:MAG: hypothetical protein AB7O61_24855 [Acidimicrobiia bacterium]